MKFYDLFFGEHSSDKDDKLDLINPTTPSTTVFPSASLGVATVNIDDCSDSETETVIKLEKVNITFLKHTHILSNTLNTLEVITHFYCTVFFSYILCTPSINPFSLIIQDNSHSILFIFSV